MENVILGIVSAILVGVFGIIGVLLWIGYRLGGIAKTVSFLERNCPLLKGSQKEKRGTE